jgi:hypothetical protein
MQKPIGYDGSDAKRGGGEKTPPGPYIMKILRATEVISSTKRPMMVLLLDIHTGPHSGKFKKLFEFLKERNPDAKWPCVYRRCMDGDQVPFFKGDIKSVEESNQGFTFNFDEKTLTGKVVGCMLGEKEINDEGKTILEPRFLCSTKTATEGQLKAPKTKAFEGYTKREPGEEPHGHQSLEPEEDLPF